jgi:hypothetical protein
LILTREVVAILLNLRGYTMNSRSILLCTFGLALTLAGCEPPTTPRGADRAAIRLSADFSGTTVTTVVVTVTASDITTSLVFNIPVVNQVAQGTIRIPPGAARTIDVQAFDTDGNVIFEGSRTIDVQPGQNPPVKIPMVSKGGSVTITATLGPVSVVVSPGSAPLAVAGTVQLTATITAADGEILTGPPEWATTDPALATVDQNGFVTAVRSGSVDIVATFAGVAGVCQVAVLSSSSPTVWGQDPTAPRASGFGEIWASSSSNIFTTIPAGDSVAHWDGATWTGIPLANLSQFVHHIWGVSPNSVYLAGGRVGSGGAQLLHFDGTSWTEVASNNAEEFDGAWGMSDALVYAVGSDGLIWNFDGTRIVIQSFLAPGNQFLGIWGIDNSNIFAVGTLGLIAHSDGRTWSLMTSGTNEPLTAVWGTSPTSIYAVGFGGMILHFDGTSWSSMTSGTTASLTGITGTGPGNIVAVGSGGTILRFDGVQWQRMPSPTTANLVGVWALDPVTFIATGDNGTMLRSR